MREGKPRQRLYLGGEELYSSTAATDTDPAALPQLLRHFVLLSYTHTQPHSLPCTHLLTHAHSASIRFNSLSPSPPPAHSLVIPLSLLVVIRYLLHVPTPRSSLGFSLLSSPASLHPYQ